MLVHNTAGAREPICRKPCSIRPSVDAEVHDVAFGSCLDASFSSRLCNVGAEADPGATKHIDLDPRFWRPLALVSKPTLTCCGGHYHHAMLATWHSLHWRLPQSSCSEPPVSDCRLDRPIVQWVWLRWRSSAVIHYPEYKLQPLL